MQIHDLPDGHFSKVKALSATVGEFIYAEPKSPDFEGNFCRVPIKIDVTKPLKNAVSMIWDGKHQIYRVKYERLPDWCAVCGHLGHVYKEHGDGIHPPSALYFKDLRATWNMRVGAGPGAGRGKGRRGGCRGGRGGRNMEPMNSGQQYSEQETCEVDAVMKEPDGNVKMVEVEDNRKRSAELNGGPKPVKMPSCLKKTLKDGMTKEYKNMSLM